MRTILTTAVLVAATPAYADGVPQTAIRVPPRVARLLIPILDLKAQALSDPREVPGAPIWRMDQLVGKLLNNTSREADEAIAALHRFYLAESSDVDVGEEAIRRGKRMLPLLRKYKGRKVIIPGRQHRYDRLIRDSKNLEDTEACIRKACADPDN